MPSRAGFATVVLLLSVLAPATTAPAAAQSCSFPVTLTDATGTEVTVGEEPSRVVTLGPSAAQTMWEIGAREKVVGLTGHAGYLAGAESRTRISTTEQQVSYEAVVDLSPDLVLAPNVVSVETVERLRDAGLTVYYFPAAGSVEDVYEKTLRIGRLVGACGGAAETVAWMRERIGVVREATAGVERPDVLYLFFGFTAGEGTFIDAIIETAGGDNVAAEANVSGYRQLSQEVVLREDPDWIVLNSADPPGTDADVINRTTAGREDQVVVVPIEHLNQPAPRIVHAVTTLAKRFHPEAYAAANATTTPTDALAGATSAAPEARSTGPTTSPATTDAPGQAGFGAVVAAVGLAAAVLLSRRR